MEHNISRLVFFLGGYDLEMVTIKKLLDEKKITYYDKKLSWGAKASDYKEEIDKTISDGLIPVLIELDNDLELPKNCILIDHHGERSGIDKPSSLRQVFDLLQLPSDQWTREFQLVDADDKGHIKALVNISASKEEIMDIRKLAWQAQGITDEQIEQGRLAISKRETLLDGKLTIVRLTHSRTAIVTDLLDPALGGPGYENLLVISPEEVNFFGRGDVIFALNEAFPGGWYGGSLPEYGYWGYDKPVSNVVEFLKDKICSNS